jgi:hypothetical protein
VARHELEFFRFYSLRIWLRPSEARRWLERCSTPARCSDKRDSEVTTMRQRVRPTESRIGSMEGPPDDAA